MASPYPSRLSAIYACAIFLLSALFLTSCDQYSSSPPEEVRVEYGPMPTGSRLSPPGSPSPRAGIIEEEWREGNYSKSQAARPQSPYGCYLATRPYSDAVRFRSIYLYFSEAAVRKAGGSTAELTFDLQISQGNGKGAVGVRYAHCVVPAVEGAREATYRHVVRLNEKKAVQAVAREVAKESSGKLRALGSV